MHSLSSKKRAIGPGNALPATSDAGPNTPNKQDSIRGLTTDLSSTMNITCLPTELLEALVKKISEVEDVVSFESASKRFLKLSESEAIQSHWRMLYEQHFGVITSIQIEAAKLAGNYKKLFASRHRAQQAATPWDRPSPFEVEASVNRLMHTSESSYTETCVVFLVDGSGSVTQGDFSTMSEFIIAARDQLVASGNPCKLAILQFSNDVRIELPAVDAADPSFEPAVDHMHRLNGGTNISLAIQRAGQLLKPMPKSTKRVLVLLTDGRVDSHQAREAHDMAARLGDEQGGVEIHCYGVGRGVDKCELLRIMNAQDPEAAEERYLALMVLDEAPW